MSLNIPKIDFIVIDDSIVDCFIAEKVILNSDLSKSCHIFQQAKQALEYIKEKAGQVAPTIVFVDEQMPLMSGIDFIKAFNALDLPGKEHYHVYLLTSSISGNDMIRLKDQPFLIKIINKPLKIRTIRNLLENDLKCVCNE